LNENRFFPTKFAVSDDSINYNLLDFNLNDSTLKIDRGVFYKPSKDNASSLKNKIFVNALDDTSNTDYSPNRTNFSIGINHNTVSKRQTSDGAEVFVPELINSSLDSRMLVYTLTTSDIARQSNEIQITFYPSVGEYNMTVVLHNQKYFDIKLSNEQISNNPRYNQRNFAEVVGYTNSNRNLDIPKTINVFSRYKDPRAPISNYSSFNLRYKGNMIYENTGNKVYQTLLTFFSETTGQFEHIQLVIKIIEGND
jgi:hypothetical protein